MMSIKKWTSRAILPVAIITMGSCSQKMNLNHTGPTPLPENADKVIHAQNQFAFKIFDLINQADQSDQNKMISPLSIYMDLSMAYNGADGQTKQAMKETLQLKGIDSGLLNQTNSALLHNLPKTDPAVNIDVANAIWYKENLQPLAPFLTLNQDYYNAKIEGSDFSNPQTVQDINGWVKEKTHEKITSIIDQIKPSDVMFLLNAVYFKGQWTKSFDAKQTQDRTFHTSSGEVQTPFMYKETKFNYAQNDKLQIVELPYGKGNFSMYVMLPSENSDVNSLAASLNPEQFSAMLADMDSIKLKLYLPKWEASYKIDNLKPELSQLGMGQAFGASADFTKMYHNNQAQISDVIHKTYIKVDEKGTEAAAVTSITIRVTSVRPGSEPVMNVDRPFVYVITEKTSGSILFLGIVNNPEAGDQ